jgi:hypothetical protein
VLPQQPGVVTYLRRFSGGGGEAWSGACDTCTHKISRQKSLEREACTVVR